MNCTRCGFADNKPEYKYCLICGLPRQQAGNFFKMYVEHVALNGAEFAVYYDGEFKKLHVFDWDHTGTRSVTNAANDLFFNKLDHLFTKYQLPPTNQGFDIYLYGTDGLISEFEPEGQLFHHSALGDPHLYPPFVAMCRDRVKADKLQKRF